MQFKDSNIFGNHFRILNTRMVQSVESVWTVCTQGIPIFRNEGIGKLYKEC